MNAIDQYGEQIKPVSQSQERSTRDINQPEVAQECWHLKGHFWSIPNNGHQTCLWCSSNKMLM